MNSYATSRPSSGDIALALGLTLGLGWWTVGYVLEDSSSIITSEFIRWTVSLIAALKPLVLIWRRSNPIASGFGFMGLSLLHFVLLPQSVPTDAVFLVVVYSLMAFAPRWAGWLGLIANTIGAATIVLAATPRALWRLDHIAMDIGMISLLGLAAWALGHSTRSRLERMSALESQTLRLQSERNQEALLAASNERTRIAREMHDIIAHSLSVIIAQADGGRYAAIADPEAGSRALSTISEVGRASLADMRRLLGVLRDTSDESTPITPQPADADLDELVRGVREAGLRVSLVRMGESRTLPPGAGLSVYRIVQEALTNSMKHAGPNARVTVLVQWLHSALALEITDDGRGAAAKSDGMGHGLVGMQERAAIFGGTVSAGPRPGGGFQVKILIPLPDDRARPVTRGDSTSSASTALLSAASGHPTGSTVQSRETGDSRQAVGSTTPTPASPSTATGGDS